ncbi:class I adenylate-forming enzyme family protein [Pandoraea sputorum]|uniref:AMP-dependent synthetase n=1 Tax=Pandoraea sputorum TaxID=93222 RepID=A0A5E5ASS3_9BURK|nr:class I adenylate-forming enzyme family protein [Pandoraea sputorum]VVE76047.1 AMP-dependent synthetase [Pandoraea sputorum]
MTHRWHNLGDLVDRSLSLDATAIVDLRDADHPRTYTHTDIDRLANGVATALRARGLPQGAHVAIASLNRAEYLIAYFGIMRGGYVAVPINIKQSREILDYVIDDAGISLAFVDGPRRDALSARVPVIDFDDEGADGFAAQIQPADFDVVRAAQNDVAQMLYTSGSTGKPKGVPLTHAGQLWALGATYVRPTHPSTERFLLAQPLFHMNGLFMAKRAFSVNGTLVILPSFDVSTYVDALERYRITVLAAVPTMFARIVKDPQTLAGRDVSSLARLMLGSAPMSTALLARIQAAFPNTHIHHGYGTTEAGPSIFGPHPDGIPLPPLALGYPLFPDTVKLVEGPDANEGVLCMRNPAVMHGYHRLPEKSAQVLRDGWYYSGDVMRRDANGFFYFVGRADDMFVCAGENIYPVEVEKVLEAHPEVRQASVVPLPDEERAAVPVAFVVRQPGSTLSVEALRQHALANGPAYQHPRRVAFVTELPWAGTNKVDRHSLLQQARSLEATQGWSDQRQSSPSLTGTIAS